MARTKTKPKKITTKRATSRKASNDIGDWFRKNKMWLFIVVFAVIGTYFLALTFAASKNPDEILAAYSAEKPTQITTEANGEVSYNSFTSTHVVMADGSLVCDNATSSSVLTGKLNNGDLRKLENEIESVDVSSVPNEIGKNADGSEVGFYEGFLINKNGEVNGFAVHEDGQKPDELAKIQDKVLKACEIAQTKTDRNKAKKPREPKFSSIPSNLASLFFPKAEAAPGSPSIKWQGWYDSHASSLATQINSHRPGHGAPSLGNRVACMNKVAQDQAVRMANRGKIYHNPDLFGEVERSCGGAYADIYRARAVGENVGVSASLDATGLFNAYVGSCGHHYNIDSRKFTYVDTNGDGYADSCINVGGNNSRPWRGQGGATWRIDYTNGSYKVFHVSVFAWHS